MWRNGRVKMESEITLNEINSLQEIGNWENPNSFFTVWIEKIEKQSKAKWSKEILIKRAHTQYEGEKRPTSRHILVKFLDIKQTKMMQTKNHANKNIHYTYTYTQSNFPQTSPVQY